ncbi:MAG: WD40-repeat-containing domain protein [Benniella sp.]|nr:MAG: WD40-repeat-containing domain protein [Benniella sp.]
MTVQLTAGGWLVFWTEQISVKLCEIHLSKSLPQTSDSLACPYSYPFTHAHSQVFLSESGDTAKAYKQKEHADFKIVNKAPNEPLAEDTERETITLSSFEALELASMYLENACNTRDRVIILVFCHEAEVSLLRAKKVAKHNKDQTTIEGIARAYIYLSKLLDKFGRSTEAEAIRKKVEKLGTRTRGNIRETGRSGTFPRTSSFVHPFKIPFLSARKSRTPDPYLPPPGKRIQPLHDVVFPAQIFPENVRPFTTEFKLSEKDEKLDSTQQLIGCLSLLRAPRHLRDALDPEARKWLEVTEKDSDEQDRLKTLAVEAIRAFKRDELKGTKPVTEAATLASVLSRDAFRDLLREFYSRIDRSGVLSVHQLEGIARLIRSGGPDYLDADDFVKILELLNEHLRDTHRQSSHHMYQLALAVSHVLDAMADTNVTDLDRKRLHDPLCSYLGELRKSSNPYLIYQAAYAYQALQCIADNEATWQAAIQSTGTVIQDVSGLVSALGSMDLNMLIEGLQDIQKETSNVAEIVQTEYGNLPSLAHSAQDFLDCLRNGYSFECKRDWYSALRGLDVMIRDGEMASFRKLVCEAPCRVDPAFQWGVCQRLAEIAANPRWDENTRGGAVEFLGELYREDAVWGKQTSIKQWILNILMQLSSSPGVGAQCRCVHVPGAEKLLQELKTNGDGKKQALYSFCLNRGPDSYPLRIALLEPISPSLVDRAQQSRLDIEEGIRQLRIQRTKSRENTVYVSPHAKASLQAPDDSCFPLMERVDEFLSSGQKVFLLLGESGSGKSIFSRKLELKLWNSYKKGNRIPLLINLAAIDKPEHDLVAKQLRKAAFTDPQIRVMKHNCKFILICDGYDESHQTRNLYTSNRMNHPGEWDIQMVICCRTEHIGVDYRVRFQPEDRNQQSDSSQLQEAVLTPFSLEQIQSYIEQYVTIHQSPWQLEDYKKALEQIPTLKELVRCPFMTTLSLEVLPRMVDIGQDLSATNLTRLGLYNHFVEQWLERSKKQLSEKDLTPQPRAVFERSSDEGFTHNGIDFMRRLAVTIYKEQSDKPIVESSPLQNEGSWKDEYLFREGKQLLRKASPPIQNGNQHRLIHRPLLKSGLSCTLVDPQGTRKRSLSEPALDSFLNFEGLEGSKMEAATMELEPDINSPLVWRNIVSDHSLLQFLEERVRMEPLFKEHLHGYIEYSKKDKKWREAAANAITILVRAGVQFIGVDLQGIQIPGANLSYGVFDSARLQDADLRNVNFRGAWLRQANMSGAQMTGAQFGELPSLVESGEVYSCAYSPDGNSIAVGLDNGSINVYTTSTWERIRTLNGNWRVTSYLVFSPKSDQIASTCDDHTVCLWDPDTGSLQHTLSHPDWVRCVAYSPQRGQVASACGDMIIRVWDAVSGACRQTLSGHTNGISCVAYSPSGQQIASGSLDRTVRLWDIEKGDCSRVLSGHTDIVWGIVYSPQGDQAASASQDTTVRIWDVETGECSRVIDGHSSAVFCVAYSPKGDQIASGGLDATVRIWDVESGHGRHTLTGHSGTVMKVVYSPNGDQIASGSFDKTVRLWNISAGTSNSVSNGHSLEVSSVKCSPKGDLIASSSADRTIRLWDVDTGTCRGIMGGHAKSVFGIAFSPQGDRIASGSSDGTVRLWDTETGTCLHVLDGHSHRVECVAYSLQGDRVASASDDNTVQIWDVETGERRMTLVGHTDAVMTVTYSPNGNQIATGSRDSTVWIWSAGTGACIQTLVGHTNWVRDVVYSPRESQLASASYDKTIRLWDVATGECNLTLSGHDDRVTSIAYSRQGNLLVSGSWDRTVRLWDVVSGQCRASIQNLPGAIHSIAWITTIEADFFVTGNGYGSVLKWKVINEGEQCSVHLDWNARNGTLVMTGASIRDASGLTLLNKTLLLQRGAIEEPEN